MSPSITTGLINIVGTRRVVSKLLFTYGYAKKINGADRLSLISKARISSLLLAAVAAQPGLYLSSYACFATRLNIAGAEATTTTATTTIWYICSIYELNGN